MSEPFSTAHFLPGQNRSLRRLPRPVLRPMNRHLREHFMSANVVDKFSAPDAESFGSAPYPVPVEDTLRSSTLTEQFRRLRQVLQRPVGFERRGYGRIPLPLLLRVTPLDQTGQRLDELATTAVGKDISPRGISFFHEQPLPHRRAIATFEHPDVGTFAMEIDLGWCQFTGTGWYVSGGRLIKTVVPMAADVVDAV